MSQFLIKGVLLPIVELGEVYRPVSKGVVLYEAKNKKEALKMLCSDIVNVKKYDPKFVRLVIADIVERKEHRWEWFIRAKVWGDYRGEHIVSLIVKASSEKEAKLLFEFIADKFSNVFESLCDEKTVEVVHFKIIEVTDEYVCSFDDSLLDNKKCGLGVSTTPVKKAVWDTL